MSTSANTVSKRALYASRAGAQSEIPQAHLSVPSQGLEADFKKESASWGRIEFLAASPDTADVTLCNGTAMLLVDSGAHNMSSGVNFLLL